MLCGSLLNMHSIFLDRHLIPLSYPTIGFDLRDLALAGILIELVVANLQHIHRRLDLERARHSLVGPGALALERPDIVVERVSWGRSKAQDVLLDHDLLALFRINRVTLL